MRVVYGKVSERPVASGRLQGTIRRQGRIEALYGGVAAVRLWDVALERWGQVIRVGLNCLEVA